MEHGTQPVRRRAAWAPCGRMLAALVLATALTAPAAGAATRPLRGPVLNVYAPGAGHVTVELLRVTLTGRANRHPPRRLRLRFPGARSLPPSVRVLYAERRIRGRRSTTYALLLLVLHRAKRRQAKTDAAARAPIRPRRPVIGRGGPDRLRHEPRRPPER